MGIPQDRKQVAGENEIRVQADWHRTKSIVVQRLSLCVLLCAALGGLMGRPDRALAGDLPVPRSAASETDGLNLMPQQQKKLAALETASRTQAHQLIGQIEKLRHTLSASYEAYSVDVTAARRANQDLNRVQGQLLDLRLSEQLQLRRILSPEQFSQLQAAIHKRGSSDDRRHDSDDRHWPHNGEKDKP